MFYCEACKEKHDWPASIMKSFGACEMCGKVATCNDVPSSALPPAKKKEDQDGR